MIVNRNYITAGQHWDVIIRLGNEFKYWDSSVSTMSEYEEVYLQD